MEILHDLKMQFIDLLLVRWIFGRQIGHKNYEDFEHPTLRGTHFGGCQIYPQLRCFAACSGFSLYRSRSAEPAAHTQSASFRGCVATARRHSLLCLYSCSFIISPINYNSSTNSKLKNSQCALAHNSKFKTLIPNSDGDRRPPCKYRTSGKKLSQNKNQF